MKPIYPIGEAGCRPHYGKPVCVILKNGTEIFGTLIGVKKGELILSYDEEEAVAPASGPTRSSRRSPKKKAPASGKRAGKGTAAEHIAQASAHPFGPSPYPAYPVSVLQHGRRVVLDIGLVGLLFTLA
ncbi:hypothetical protein P9314_26330 [Paenibacillus validus]|uniref:Uncharacterized protein n=1 Tax=Paenibacillus validus TaxID=44253 RepID=A0A7X2ZDP7_9BACL|nr:MULTISPECIES: hypothetical protein [Paenibacillus]MED4604149.1 hypothetical protein [Paenibacillus validus]MED4609068.1 hypothetical protein [Paenibacillus validus]MUG72962.1 hypothetical protein [Paenibacillus validus]